MSRWRTLDIRDHLEPGTLGEGMVVDRTLSGGGPRPLAPVIPSALLPRHFAFFPLSIPETREGGSAAPLHVLSAESAAVAGMDGAVLFEAGWVDRIHLYFVNYGREGGQFRRPEGGARTIEAAAPGRRLRGEYFLGFNAAYANYAHWMTDGLPGLLAYRDGYMERGCRLLLPPTPAGHFVDQTLDLLGIPGQVVERIADEVATADTLYFLSYFNFTHVPDYAVEAQRVLKDTVLGLPAPRSRRIFISRPDSRGRRLLNEAEVVDALSALGVEVVAPGLLSVADQVRAFHSAELVVGPHGAGLVNCGFCEPGSTLLELFSEYTTQGLFWTTASAARMRYGFVAGTSIDQDWGLWSELDNWDAPYVLDPAAVADGARKALEQPEWALRPARDPAGARRRGDHPNPAQTETPGPMTAKQALLSRLGHGRDPFETFPPKLYAGDLQGWNSDHAYLREVVTTLRPSLVVEVGVWKGCSVITMASEMKARGVDGAVLAVDTWLGSWDHWLVDAYFEDMGFQHGYPTLFWRFMANVAQAGVQDHVVPMPLDSLNAYEVLHRKGMQADAVHIDAGHDYRAVRKDLESWWSLIRPGGVLIADDYFDDENKAWPEVKRAVDDFVRNGDLPFRHDRGKAWIDKPA